MTVFEKMVSTQMLMFLYALVGAVMAKTRMLKPEARAGFIALLMNIALPCLTVDAFNSPIDKQELLNVWKILVISTCALLLSLGLAAILWRKETPERRAVLNFATTFSNCGYAGMPIVSMVFGAQGVLMTSFVLLPVRVLMWTVGVSLFVKQKGRQRWLTLLKTPSMIGVFVGLIFLLTPIKLTGAPANAVHTFGGMTGPLSMILIGASLIEMPWRQMLDKEVFGLCAVRLALIPLAAMVVLRLLKVDTLLWQVQIVLLGMPCASNTAIIAEMYGRDHTFATKCVFLSTVLSLFTVPCLTLLF